MAIAVVMIWLLRDGLMMIDAFQYKYTTPWYDNSWLVSPVTKTVLLFGKSEEYITNNAIGTETWWVRDTHFAGKVFWTRVDRWQRPTKSTFREEKE